MVCVALADSDFESEPELVDDQVELAVTVIDPDLLAVPVEAALGLPVSVFVAEGGSEAETVKVPLGVIVSDPDCEGCAVVCRTRPSTKRRARSRRIFFF